MLGWTVFLHDRSGGKAVGNLQAGTQSIPAPTMCPGPAECPALGRGQVFAERLNKGTTEETGVGHVFSGPDSSYATCGA